MGETIKKKRLKRAKVSDEIASTLETCSLKRSDSRMHEIRLRAETVSFWVDGDGGGLPSWDAGETAVGGSLNCPRVN